MIDGWWRYSVLCTCCIEIVFHLTCKNNCATSLNVTDIHVLLLVVVGVCDSKERQAQRRSHSIQQALG